VLEEVSLGMVEEKRHTVHLDEDGRVIIEFAKPIKSFMYATIFFGNVRGVELMVGRKGKKEQVIGVRFESVEVLKLFHRVNGWPKDFNEVLAVIEDLQRKRKEHATS